MARIIPDAELERIKRDVSLVRLIESQGHTLAKRGRDWVMRCVFHEETTPSLSISESKNLYHCFGCNAAGSVLDWVMKTQGVSLLHAVQLLQNGAPMEGERVGVARSHKRHLPAVVAPDAMESADEQAVLRQVTDYYHTRLKESPEALAYLQGRGLVSGELVDRFKLGYADRTLTYRLPPSHTVAGRDVRARLQTLGVYRSSGHEHLNGCLVVPVIGIDDAATPEHSWQILQLYGRRIAPAKQIAADSARHLYLPRPLKGVWNEAALVADREIIVCEALIDAMTFWCAGHRNVIAAYGVNGFTADHWQALKRHGTKRVLIAYDRDDAGNAAAEKLSVELLEAGIECFRVLFPKGMDANDLIHGGSRGHHLQYELLYDGATDTASHLCGLIDPAELDKTIDNDARKSGQHDSKSASSQAQVTPKAGSSQTAPTQAAPGLQADLPEIAPKARIRGNGQSSLAVVVA